MAKKSLIAKFQRGSKFTVRNRNRSADLEVT